MTIFRQSILFIFLMTGLFSSAYAYLDPGTGSIILQGLIAGVMGALFVIKLYWMKFKKFIIRLLYRLKGLPPPKEEKAKTDKRQEDGSSVHKDE